MSSLVVDTHTAIWYLANSPKLSPKAPSAIDDAIQAGNSIYLAAISSVEVIYLVEKGNLPPVALERLQNALNDPGSSFVLAPLDLAVAWSVRHIPRDAIPDMPDRIIAATAMTLGLPLVTRDHKIRAADIETIW